MQRGEHALRRTGAAHQRFKLLQRVLRRTAGTAQGCQLVQVFLPDELDGLFSRLAPETEIVQYGAHDPQMGEVETVLRPDHPQTLAGEGQHLADAVVVHVADALQPHLPDLPKAAGALGDAVDVLIVVDLLHQPRAGAGGADDGQRHVRLQGHQPAVGVGEADDVRGDEKVLVVHVQLVLLKLAHLVLDIAEAGIEGAEREGDPLFVFEDRGVEIHGDLRKQKDDL